MKFLLTAINAKYIHSNLAVYSLRASALAQTAGRRVPAQALGLYSSGPPGKGGHRAGGIHHQPPHRGDSREIYLRKPDVLLFSCYIWNIVYVRELAENCRKIMPEVPIWLGGPEVSYDAEETLRKIRLWTEFYAGKGRRPSGCWQSAMRPDRLIRSTLRKSRDLYSGNRREARSAGRKAGRRFSGKHSRQRRRPQAVLSA